MGLFELKAEPLIRAAVQRLRAQENESKRSKFATAIDFLEGNYRGHIESVLQNRFPSSQRGDSGQRIHPVCVGLVERYVAEQANAYNRPVSRYFVDESGAETDATKEQTKRLQGMLDACGYDDLMHRAEQIAVLLKTSCVWFQAKRGQLRPVLVMPHDVFPIAPEGPAFIDACDPDDYEAFSVELFWATDDVSRSQARTFAYLSKQETIYYTGPSPGQIEEILSRWPNPYEWSQTTEGPMLANGSQNYTTGTMPGRMLTFMHSSSPLGNLVPDSDVDIVDAATEISVAMSTLFDNIRFQGHSVPVKKLNNPGDAKAIQRHGVRFPVVMDINESFELASAATNYTEQVQVLKDFVRLVSVTKRLSPNDMALDGTSPASGFAKLVDSLPKLDARQERIRRLAKFERENSERIKAIGILLGSLDASAAGMTMRSQFAEVEFPKSEQEKDAWTNREIEHGWSSEASLLAKRDGISSEEAQVRIDANRATQVPAKIEPQAGDFLSGFGSKIGRRAAKPA